MFRVAIIGGANTENYQYFQQKVIACIKNKAKTDGIVILSTGDEYVEAFAKHFGIDIEIYYADWKKNGSNALVKRNELLLSKCDAIIAFNDGVKDTKKVLESAIYLNIPYRLIPCS